MKKTSCCSGSSCCGSSSKDTDLSDKSKQDVREIVKERYGAAVKAVIGGAKGACCGSSAVDLEEFSGTDPITRNLYGASDREALPEEAILASFGCGNPTALAELKPGEIVLDLGSGGGIDVLLSARKVGPQGKAYGVDMTDEMLDLARRNAAKVQATNVEFLRGSIESIPLPNQSVDVIISNCVINLSPDKDQVLREAFRVLKPGGRLAIADIVLRRPLTPEIQKSMKLWTGCVAGALLDKVYLEKLHSAGFIHESVEPTRIYSREDTEEMAASFKSENIGPTLEALDGALMSAFVRAIKP